MKIKSLLMSASVFSISLSVSAFFNTNSFPAFGSGTGYNSTVPWSNNANWNPMSMGGGQYSPANDAKNLSRYGAYPRSLQQYRQDPRFRPANSMMPMANPVQPSNWLTDTDFSKTLEQIKSSGNKTFFVNEMPINFEQGYQHIQNQTEDIQRAIETQMKNYRNTDSIYGKQGYELSPAASSTSRVESE
ncbi:MAG: hypothetical protein ISR70_01035 [Candidatus Thioglobus sp.]|nr:hypothetical protein [Candidatus Thioglobus pontius]MBL6976629.1 hypothetical protein [Candidatus Thioglobus sp.]MBL6984136.1 hypothetical protein [Candidatus Thioglobus sp.]